MPFFVPPEELHRLLHYFGSSCWEGMKDLGPGTCSSHHSEYRPKDLIVPLSRSSGSTGPTSRCSAAARMHELQRLCWTLFSDIDLRVSGEADDLVLVLKAQTHPGRAASYPASLSCPASSRARAAAALNTERCNSPRAPAQSGCSERLGAVNVEVRGGGVAGPALERERALMDCHWQWDSVGMCQRNACAGPLPRGQVRLNAEPLHGTMYATWP